jgi:internalin A
MYQDGHLRMRKATADEIESLCGCSGLKSLDLKKSQIASMPACLGDLPNLKSLSLKKSTLPRFPEEVLACTALKELDLSFTNISYLPPAIAEMPALRKLILSGSQIENLPKGIAHLEYVEMRFIDLNNEEQEAIRAKYPRAKIFFSSPCECD